MGALERLYRALEPLHLYRLRQGSLIDAELTAYSAGFALIEEQLAELQLQMAVQTAGGEALAQYESLVGLTARYQLDDETRRELVLYRLGSAPLDFSLTGMHNAVRAAGLVASISEELTGEALTICGSEVLDPTLGYERLLAGVAAVLPAHLLLDFDVGALTWSGFDEADCSWNLLDSADYTWDSFDLNSSQLPTG